MSKDARIQGIAVALAEVVRLHGSETEAADVLQGFGLDRASLRKAGVEARDLKALSTALDFVELRANA